METNKTQKSPTVRIETTSDIMKQKKAKSSTLGTLGLIMVVAIIVLAGVSTGYALAQRGGTVTTAPDGTIVVKGEKTVGTLEEGVNYDEAEGKLVEGGIDGEGTHHLERPGGDSKNVYLTSSLVDLSAFVGKEVKVWGETNAAQKAGWLMDVAKLEAK